MSELIKLALRGMILGFSIAAPVGPIGVLCIRRTLTQGRVCGLVSGLGAASADAFYGCVAGFGLTFLSSALVQQQVWFRLAGGLFLCYLGIKTFLDRPAEKAAEARTGLAGAYVSTFLLTLSNPVTILSFVAILAGLGAAVRGVNYGATGALVLGVFTGSAMWWLLLSSSVGLFRHRLTSGSLRWINRISGVIIITFGALALAANLTACG